MGVSLEKQITATGEAVAARNRLSLVSAPRQSPSQSRNDGLTDCRRCENRRWVADDKRGARRCRCMVRHLNRRALSMIGTAHFGKPKLLRLRAMPELHADQPALVAEVKTNPDESYLLCGDYGVGKTHIGWALYRYALAAGRKPHGFLLQDLLDDLQAWELMTCEARETALRGERGGRPRILADDLKIRDARMLLFIDEFEKARVSEFTSRELFRLLNAARDFGHQLVITANQDWNALQATWCKADPVYGGSIMKRLEGCRYRELFLG